METLTNGKVSVPITIFFDNAYPPRDEAGDALFKNRRLITVKQDDLRFDEANAAAQNNDPSKRLLYIIINLRDEPGVAKSHFVRYRATEIEDAVQLDFEDKLGWFYGEQIRDKYREIGINPSDLRFAPLS